MDFGPDQTLFAAFGDRRDLVLCHDHAYAEIAYDDAQAPQPESIAAPVSVYVGSVAARVLYAGRSGCCAGIDQIVFTIPDGVQGCYVPLVVKNGNNVSNYTSIAVSQNGGACSDPFGYTSSELSTAARSTRPDCEARMKNKFPVTSNAPLKATMRQSARSMRRGWPWTTSSASPIAYAGSAKRIRDSGEMRAATHIAARAIARLTSCPLTRAGAS